MAQGSEDNVSVLMIAINDDKLHSVPVSDKVKKRREKLAEVASSMGSKGSWIDLNAGSS